MAHARSAAAKVKLRTLDAVTVASTATRLATAHTSPAATQGILVQNPSDAAASVFVGDSSVTTANGVELAPGDREVFPVADAYDLYAIVASGTQAVRVAVV